MKLNNIWGYGQLFGFSGLDGVCRFNNDFVGTLTRRKIEVRFELYEWVKLYLPEKGRVTFSAITGDMIEAKCGDKEYLLLFVNADTVVGFSPTLPEIKTEKKWNKISSDGIDIYFNSIDAVALVYEKVQNGYKFALSHSESAHSIARAEALQAIKTDLARLRGERYEYYKKIPKCKNEKFERLYYKAVSVNRVNVHSPEGSIPCRWTTPDRVPHKRMWLWDSVFHALAIVTYDEELAKDAIRAVLSQQREDGFIPAMMNPYGKTGMTQPPVLAFGVWELYKKTGDISFLRECACALSKYLVWDIENRDENKNGLLEWLTDFKNEKSRCGESGLDNSPRFDFEGRLDAIDFSTFIANDAESLANIYFALSEKRDAEIWRERAYSIKEKINELLWDEKSGVYYDRIDAGDLTRVLTPASFFPLFAGIPSAERASRMVELLVSESQLWTSFPVASIAKSHPSYSTDMWRGGVWLNVNYIIAMGLKRYGFCDLADKLIEKTLLEVNKWYKKTGVIYEFFDPEGKVPPYECERKGKPSSPPDLRRHVHSISDFNWSASFTLMMIQGEEHLV